MVLPPWLGRRLAAFALSACLLAAAIAPSDAAGVRALAIWNVDELRPGMKGYGLSVFLGSRLERFEAEILGVLKNTSPGRDMVLARLSGCGLEKSGVVAGMSGSPIYVEGKLVGALAFGWAFGKDPIAGITPFRQMADYAAQLEPEDGLWRSRRLPLSEPLRLGDERFAAAEVAGFGQPLAAAQPQTLVLQPLQTPLAASGFSAKTLERLEERFRGLGLVPMQMGGAAGHVKRAEAAPLRAGAPLAVALVTGDFDMSGVGTVTHLEGKRVYGWGHPFMSLGRCELPLFSAHIHTIYPRQTVSFKMGSPLKEIGALDADTSVGIAGVLGQEARMIPVETETQRGSGGEPRRFVCKAAAHRQLLPQLVFGILANSVDLEGDLPEELTAQMKLRIELEGEAPIVIDDAFSGALLAGGRAPIALYSQASSLLQTLLAAPFAPIQVKQVACVTRFLPYRATAEIDAVRLASETFAPGDTMRVTVALKPYRGERQNVEVKLPLPESLPEGEHTLTLCDGPTHVRMLLRENPLLSFPQSRAKLLEQQRLLAGARRTHLFARLAVPTASVAAEGAELRNLPASVAEQLSDSRRGGAAAQPLPTLAAAETATPFVLQGMQKLKFTVSRRLAASTNP